MAVPAPRGALAPNEYEVLGVVTEFNPFVTYKELVHGCMEFVDDAPREYWFLRRCVSAHVSCTSMCGLQGDTRQKGD